jgi:PadR family transcriptional regulator PadR
MADDQKGKDLIMVENSKSQMRKGILEYCILSIISRKEVYTSDILEALRRADLLVVEGTLYPLLSRLKNNGLLKYRWQESTDGPPRKYFTLTDEGLKLLAALNDEWAVISNAITKITNI